MRAFLAKHWFIIFLALTLAATLVFPRAVDSVTGVWEARQTVAFSLFLMAWTMPTDTLLAELRHPIASLWAVFLSYGFVPVASALLGLLAPDQDVAVGLILVSSVPCTLSSAVLWTRLAGGNEATALLTVMGTTCISWFMTTAWLSLLTGTVVALNPWQMMLDLFLSLIVPTLLGQTLRVFPPCARFGERHKRTIGAISQCFVLAIILKAGVAVGDKMHSDQAWDSPRIFGWSVTLAVTLHLVSLVSGFWTARFIKLDRARQIAVAFASSQKTLQVSLVLYEQYFKERFPYAVMPLLFYHVGQLLLDTLIARRLRHHVATDETQMKHG